MTESFHSSRTPDPAALELDAQLDMLVDDELTEDDRRALLTAVESNPAQWRQVATRFLERQAERKAVRQFIAAGAGTTVNTGPAQEIPPTYPFRGRHLFQRMNLRNVAAVLVVGVLSAYGGMTFSPHGSNTNVAGGAQQASFFSTFLPAALTGSSDPQQKVSVEVPLVASDQMDKLPAGYPFDDAPPREAQGAHHVVIMPMGDGSAVMFPVNSMPAAEYH